MLVQRLHSGFASSHFTRRILQVEQPVRVLGLLARPCFGLLSLPAEVAVAKEVLRPSLILLPEAPSRDNGGGCALLSGNMGSLAEVIVHGEAEYKIAAQ